MAMAKQPELLPTESLVLDYNLSLIPRLKILLSFTRSDIFLKPIDEWQLRLSLTNLLRDSLAITVSDGDITVEKFKDLKKRKRVEPVASGVVYLWDLSKVERGMREETRSLNERFEEWKNYVVGKLDGVELNVEGLKLRISAEVPAEDEFQKMKMSWEEFYAARSRETLMLSGAMIWARLSKTLGRTSHLHCTARFGFSMRDTTAFTMLSKHFVVDQCKRKVQD